MRVNEIFYSLQGEGHFTGTAAVFLRLSGCNLKCSFCDTDHWAGSEMSVGEIVRAVVSYPSRHLVITGGEPSLQLTSELIDALHAEGFFIQVETNGSRLLPEGVDWITCSPKSSPIVYTRVDELKVVFFNDSTEELIGATAAVEAADRRLQPCDSGDRERNLLTTAACIDYIKLHPEWKLSLQTHKMLGIR